MMLQSEELQNSNGTKFFDTVLGLCVYWHQIILKEILKILQLQILVKSQNADTNSEEEWKTAIIF